MLPEISFVVPVLNGSKSISKCLDSILSQKSFINFEVIVVDNNSTDDTKKIVKKYNDNRINYIFEHIQRRSCARNRGIYKAKGTWIAFIDCDVTLDPNWLYECYEVICKNNLSGGQGKVIPKSDQIGLFASYRYELISKMTNGSFCNLNNDRFHFPMINSAACIYKKKDLVEVDGFDTSLEGLEDADLTGRLWIKGANFATVPKAIANVFWYSGTFISYFMRFKRQGQYVRIFSRVWKFDSLGLIGFKKYKFSLSFFNLIHLISNFFYFIGCYNINKIPESVHSRSVNKIFFNKILSPRGDLLLVLPKTTRYFWTDNHLVLKDIRSRKKAFIDRKIAPPSKLNIEKILSNHLEILQDQDFFVFSITNNEINF